MAHGVRSGIMSLTVSGTADLFTVHDFRHGFCHCPCIIEALNQRLMAYLAEPLKQYEFFAAIAHWFSTQHYAAMNPQSVVYGLSVIYMVSGLIRQSSETGEGVVIRTPPMTHFTRPLKVISAVMPVALEKQADGWFCDMGKLEAVLAKPECKIMLLCSPQILRKSVDVR